MTGRLTVKASPIDDAEATARERLDAALARLDLPADATAADIDRAIADADDEVREAIIAAVTAGALVGRRRLAAALQRAGWPAATPDRLDAAARDDAEHRGRRLAAATLEAARQTLRRAHTQPEEQRGEALRRAVDQVRTTTRDRSALAAVQDGAGVGLDEHIDEALDQLLTEAEEAQRAHVAAGLEYRWLTQQDERVRESHAAQHGTTRPRGARWPNDCRWPGDTDAPVEEWINCRCYLEPVVEPARELAAASHPGEGVMDASDLIAQRVTRAAKGFPGEFPFDSMSECMDRMGGEVADPGAFCAAWYHDTHGQWPAERAQQSLTDPVADAVADALQPASSELESAQLALAWKSRRERIVEGPVLVPGEPDADGDTLTADEVRQIARTFLQHGGLHDVEHDFTARSGVTPVESYTLPEARDGLPEGTWMLAARVDDPDLVAAIDAGELRGWSVTATHAHAADRLASAVEASAKAGPMVARVVPLSELDDPHAVTVTLTRSPKVRRALWTSVKSRLERMFTGRPTVTGEPDQSTPEGAEPMDAEAIKAAAKAGADEAIKPLEERLTAVEASVNSAPPNDPTHGGSAPDGDGDGGDAAAKGDNPDGNPGDGGRDPQGTEVTYPSDDDLAATVKAAVDAAVKPLTDRLDSVESTQKRVIDALPPSSRKAYGRHDHTEPAAKPDGPKHRDPQGRSLRDRT